MKRIPLSLLLLSACRVVAGTDELFICDEETCPAGGGPAGGSNAGGDDVGGAGACGEGKLGVQITVVGPLIVEIDSTGEELSTGTSERCLDSGEQRLRASCSDESNVDVAWGNDLCADGDDTCDFTLAEAEIFVVDAALGCD